MGLYRRKGRHEGNGILRKENTNYNIAELKGRGGNYPRPSFLFFNGLATVFL
jgi:hypothetical protein